MQSTRRACEGAQPIPQAMGPLTLITQRQRAPLLLSPRRLRHLALRDEWLGTKAAALHVDRNLLAPFCRGPGETWCPLRSRMHDYKQKVPCSGHILVRVPSGKSGLSSGNQEVAMHAGEGASGGKETRGLWQQ